MEINMDVFLTVIIFLPVIVIGTIFATLAAIGIFVTIWPKDAERIFLYLTKKYG